MNTPLFPKMCERGEPFNRQLHNNNQVEGVLAEGDANANAIQHEDEGRTGDTSSGLQDRVTGWGPDSQCDDPELAEFEMLECQELEMYLVEEGEDYVGLKDRTDVEMELKAERQEAKRPTLQGAVESSTEESRTEMHSEADVFLSCVSTMSTTDNATDESVRTLQADSVTGPRGKSTTQPQAVDMNSNSTVDAAANSGPVPCRNVSDDCKKNNNQRNEAGKAASDLNHERKGEREAAAAARNSHEDTSNKKNKSTQAAEAAVGHGSPQKSSTRGPQSSPESRGVRKQGSFHNTLRKQNSFDRSFKKQPSFDNSLKKQGSFENSTVSSLERRRPWGSPSRPATPSSPKMTSSSTSPSLMRRPPASPAKVQGPRTLSSERSESPQRSAKMAAKASSSSCIPKPVAPQQKDGDCGKSSPPQKAKNTRPKIITYVRKAPQSRVQGTDVPLEGSCYPGLKAQKDPKSSSFLFDKHRQEMQKAGPHPSGTGGNGMRPASSSAPQRLGRKSGSFHEDVTEKYLQEVRNPSGFGLRIKRSQSQFTRVVHRPGPDSFPRVSVTSARSSRGRRGPSFSPKPEASAGVGGRQQAACSR